MLKELRSCDFTGLPAPFHDGHVHIDLDMHTGNRVLPIVGLSGTGKTLMLRLFARAYGVAYAYRDEVEECCDGSLFQGDEWRDARFTLTRTDGTTIEGSLFHDDHDWPYPFYDGSLANVGLDSSKPPSLREMRPSIVLLQEFLPDVVDVEYPENEPFVILRRRNRTRIRLDESQLPRGMMRGLNILRHVEQVFRDGGLLLVDGLEDGLDEHVVRDILDLFQRNYNNRTHAFLAFTTHRPELMDSVPDSPVLAMTRILGDRDIHSFTIPPQTSIPAQTSEDRFTGKRRFRLYRRGWGDELGWGEVSALNSPGENIDLFIRMRHLHEK